MFFKGNSRCEFKCIWRHTLRSETIFCKWKPYKNDEKCFLFHLKVLFVLQIFKFLPWLFGHLDKNNLIRKIASISKFMTSQARKLKNSILPNISRNKGNQRMKFGQLIEYNMRNILWIFHKIQLRYCLT